MDHTIDDMYHYERRYEFRFMENKFTAEYMKTVHDWIETQTIIPKEDMIIHDRYIAVRTEEQAILLKLGIGGGEYAVADFYSSEEKIGVWGTK